VTGVSTDAASPEVVVEALGVPVGIPVTGDDARRLRRQWSRALSDRAAIRVVDLEHLPADDDGARDYAITTLVTMAALDSTAGQRINLHAGAVADEQGRVLAVIGPSGSGKTTAIGLLATRLGYLSDETVSIDGALLVHGHPKPLSVVGDPSSPSFKDSVSPDDLGLLHPPSTSHLHRIVLLHRGDDDSGLVPLSPAYAIAEVVEQTSSLVELEHPILRLAETIDACGGVWGLNYREITDQVDRLIALLDREPQPAPGRVHHPGRDAAEAVPGAWRRAAWLDAVEYDDELVVMVGDRVHVLAGLGVLAWLALESPRTAGDLEAEATALWGGHPDAGRLVEEALGVLADQGLVHRPG
jgi:energy-coupling factor transporter ATP-binding protein EcfA2